MNTHLRDAEGQRTYVPGLLANLAMLSGLFGTVEGVKSFGSVSGKSVDPVKARILAAGISEAMEHTMFGLGAAIIALSASLFATATQSLEDDINRVSVEVLNLVVTNREKVNIQQAA